MKFVLAVLLSIGTLAFANVQENSSSKQAVSPSIGLQVGQKAPPFALSDQFGHEQSNDSLKGPNGTILLFFRSADW